MKASSFAKLALRAAVPMLGVLCGAGCKEQPRAAEAGSRAATDSHAEPPPAREEIEAPATTSTALLASPPTASTAPPPRDIGPYELPFLGERTVYFVVPPTREPPHRLLAMLHGVCNPPAYACGLWATAAARRGFLVCPTGEASCGRAAYDAPTWKESHDAMGADLEKAVDAVQAVYPGEIERDGAVLAGFSRGAYAAATIALHNPGRWRYLLLVEADVSLSAARLRDAGVAAVAMLAGERGTQRRGEERTVKALTDQGMPAHLWLMRDAGHHYSADIDALMDEALDWLLRDRPPKDAGP